MYNAPRASVLWFLPVLMLSVYTWGYFWPAYIRRSNVFVPTGSGRYKGATQTNYFHTSRKSHKSYTNENIERKAKFISQATFEKQWKEQEKIMRCEQLAWKDAMRSEIMKQLRWQFMQTRAPSFHDDVTVCHSPAITYSDYDSWTVSRHLFEIPKVILSNF